MPIKKILPVLVLLILIAAACSSNPDLTPTGTLLPNLPPVATLLPPCQSKSTIDQNENRWVSIGPYGGSIRGIVINPINSNIVYVATYGAGVFRSDDGGDTWLPASIGIENTSVTEIVLDPMAPNTLYAGTGGSDGAHVYQSDDNGEKWTRLNDKQDWVFNEITSMVVSPRGLLIGSQAVYAIEGSTWKQLSEGFLGNGFIHLALDPNNDSTLYAGTYQGGLYCTVDSGVTWQRLDPDIFSTHVNVIAVDPSNSNRLLVTDDDNGLLYLSEDRGTSWSPVIQKDDVQTIVFDPNQPERVWMGSDQGLSRSDNGGNFWQDLPDFPGVRVESISLDPNQSDVIFVGTYKRGLFRSRDGGESWESANIGISNSQVSAIAVDSGSSTRIYAGTLGDGLFSTDDWGKSWSQVSGELASAYVKSLAINPAQPTHVFAGVWDGLFASYDAGQSWTRTGKPLEGKQVISLVVIPGEDETVYAGTHGDGLFVSRDGGLNWTALAMPQRYITALVVDSSNSRQLYAGTLNGVYRSDDAGDTWIRVSSGFYDINVTALSLGTQSGWLVAATGDGVYLSYDHAETWQRRSGMLGPDYFTAVIAGEQPVAASWKGVFFGASDDYSWIKNSTGLLNHRITSLAQTGDIILAGTYGGGVNILRQACRPVYGLVTDAVTGQPVFARVVIKPGLHTTYSDKDGSYAFESLPPGQYTVTAELSDRDRSESIEADLETKSSLRLDLSLPADLQTGSWPLEVISPPDLTTFLSGEIVSLVLRTLPSEEFYVDSEIIWTTGVKGRLGASEIDESGVSRLTYDCIVKDCKQ